MDAAASQQRLLAILNFWHKVEFFIPFDLDQRLAEAEDDRVRWVFAGPASNAAGAQRSLWQVDLPDDYEVKAFYLYLGIFDKGELATACIQLPADARPLPVYEEEERADLDGNTCYARLKLTSAGDLTPDSEFDSVSVSTLPWALGQLKTHGLPCLTHARFDEARQQLSGHLQNFRSVRHPGPLTLSQIGELRDIVCRWGSFRPIDDSRVGAIEIRTGRKKPPPLPPDNQALAEEGESDDLDEPEPSIGILNSFFIEDIERAMALVRSGHVPPTLASYLQPLAPELRVDLNSAAGHRAIFEALHPSRLNRGHWFANPDRTMSLMQQFAINTALQSLEMSPLFSVNGPPGTGKTTLSQDMFAELIVRRARVLAGYKEARQAFEPGHTAVHLEGVANEVRIVKLKPELTGFEMVVASSNNKAVENISRELPKTGEALGSEWRSVAYLQTVAHKVAAQKADGGIAALEPGDEPWGLIACVLGKSANRRAFKERFAFMRVPESDVPTLRNGDRPQTIYEWIDSYRGPSFADAAAAFRSVAQEVEQRCTRLAETASHLSRKFDGAEESLVTQEQEQQERHRHYQNQLKYKLQQAEAAASSLQNTLARLREDERLIERTSPGWWARFRRTPAALTYRHRAAENAAAQLQARSQWAKGRKQEVSLAEACDAAEKRSVELQAQLEFTLHQLATREEALGSASGRLPSAVSDLEKDDFQKQGLWHDQELDRLRTALFAAALGLHEAWLADVARKSAAGGAGFRANIMALTKLLSNKRTADPAHTLAIWQSLFLIVPVVSTTFASFANQFRDLPPAALGWLFIDEAGQAVPQAAVGALWRAQHAVVVGDPQQIEPVFTLPGRFLSALAGLSEDTADGHYSPHRTSVQRLADQANRYGTILSNAEQSPVWVGSPLRVHRRCIEPMFSWANAIAYDKRMIFGLASRHQPNGPPILCDSAWIDLKGATRRRQEVPQQTCFVVDVVTSLFRRDGRLPDLYLISPFKAVKQDLAQALLQANWMSAAPEFKAPSMRSLRTWCSQRIGTVHTFQGKQEDTVFMILGADARQASAAEWASSEPNLLNVAVTRAKRRFYLVGDRSLWGSMGSFHWSSGVLPTIAPSQFLSLIEKESQATVKAKAGSFM